MLKLRLRPTLPKANSSFWSSILSVWFLEGPYFNKELQTESPKFETFQIVHLKPWALFHVLQPAQAEDVAL